MIRLSDISKAYGPQKVFDNFSLEIENGKILCVLGESGGGKTTLLNILAGLVPFSGNLSGVPKRVSYIFQEPRLLPNMTVKQNLAYAGGAPEKIDDILEKTELIKGADKRPGELSGGEKQRVSLARAFLIPSELLLMDEPFSSLDTALKIRLTEVFARLWKSLPEKRTAVFVTHDLEEALMLADRIIVLKSGQVAADVSLKREVFPSAYAAPCEERQKLLSVLLEGEKC